MASSRGAITKSSTGFEWAALTGLASVRPNPSNALMNRGLFMGGGSYGRTPLQRADRASVDWPLDGVCLQTQNNAICGQVRKFQAYDFLEKILEISGIGPYMVR